LVKRVVASGRAWVAPTTYEGRDVVRICATHGETSDADVEELVAALNARELPASTDENCSQNARNRG
jgi:hypothetical protein